MNNTTGNSSVDGDPTSGGLPLFAQVTMTLMIITMVVIIAGNLLVVAAVMRFRALRDVTGIFVANLAIADLVTGFSLPYQIIFFIYPDLSNNKHLCLLRYNIITFALNASMYSLACTVIDRYLAISYPMTYSVMMTDRVAYLLVSVIWVVDLAIAFIPQYGANNWDILPVCLYETVVSKYFRLMNSLIGCSFALLMFLLYARIFIIVQKHLRQILTENSLVNSDDHTFRRRRQMTKVMALVVLFFQISWLPFFCIQMTMLEPQSVTMEKVMTANFLVFLGIMNSMINPVIYAWKNRQYRRAFKQLLSLNVEDDTQTSVVSTLQ